jgi:hypothetical protein
MRSLALLFFVAGSIGLVATAAHGSGQKMVEIDKAGNVRTSTGRDIGRIRDGTEKPEAAEAKASSAKSVDICAPGYTWSSDGVSAETADRARAFYRDMTQPYELEATKAHEGGAALSRAREAEYWNAYDDFMRRVPETERKIVTLGVSPRLAWSCTAPPVIHNEAKPVSASTASQPPPAPPRY